MEKEFVTADGLTENAFRLSAGIYASGFRPDMILVVWRGGSPVGIAVHEYFKYRGVHAAHAVVTVESYTGIGQQAEPRLSQLDPVLAEMDPEGQVLLVDDIFDSGRTIQAVRDAVAPRCRALRTATVYYKACNNKTDFEPDYFVVSTDKWVVFPHELTGLSEDEIREKSHYLPDLLR